MWCRLFYMIFNIAYRPKRVDINGEKYRDKIKDGSVFVVNHGGFGDPVALGVCFFYRRVHFLTAEVIMKKKFIGTLLKGMGCIKIDRNISDIEAIKKCVLVLKKGKRLVLFPQGGIDRSGGIEEIKSGAVLIALQAGVPIVPLFTLKREHWYQRRLYVIGNDINCKDFCSKKIPSMNDINNISNEIKDQLEKLKATYERIAK